MDELTWAPASRITEMVAAREVSPVEVLEHFLGRIEEHDGVARAFEHLDLPRARSEAKAAEAAVLAGEPLGALHGVPTAVKSHIDIAGVPETMPFGNGIARLDHPVVERLRGAGALVIGHTRMPAGLATGAFDMAASARNPWDTTRTAGASSAGTAAAVAGGLLPVAIGSDGGGLNRPGFCVMFIESLRGSWHASKEGVHAGVQGAGGEARARVDRAGRVSSSCV